MSEFKVGDRVIIGGNKLGVVIDNKEKFENMVSVFEDGAEYACWVEKIGLKLVKNTDQLKIEQLEQRIEKLEKCVMGEQNSLEKCENESIYERNERFAKILKKELERNAIILNESKPSLLTEDERVILRNLDKKWKWIARDSGGQLFIFTEKPHKQHDTYWSDKISYMDLCLFNRLFNFIRFGNDEPYNIEELLKGECGNE